MAAWSQRTPEISMARLKLVVPAASEAAAIQNYPSPCQCVYNQYVLHQEQS
jgi:hypothetical protein